ncbi:MAG: hypothetical protein Q9218_005225 [Villophora microphyllina]
MARTLHSLPHEVQLGILSLLDGFGLSNISRVNKDLSAKAIPILWRSISLDSDLEFQQNFFHTCNYIIEKQPDRWQYLAARVRYLDVGRLLYTAIPLIDWNKPWQWQDYYSTEETRRTIYDIIADLKNIEELSLYIKEYDFMALTPGEKAKSMRLPQLSKLKIGGIVPKQIALAMLAHPETIEELSCIGLQDGEAGQQNGPGGLFVLSSIQERFTRLRVLHLCKMAELSDIYDEDGYNEPTGLRWPWDTDNDRLILDEWAGLLKGVSKTLIALTIEDRYLVYEHRMYADRSIEPAEGDNGDPEDWGRASSQRFCEILLPVIAEQVWPRLQKLTLVGLTVRNRAVKNADALDNLQPRVQMEFRPGGVMTFNDDATPIDVSPPSGYFTGYQGRHS